MASFASWFTANGAAMRRMSEAAGGMILAGMEVGVDRSSSGGENADLFLGIAEEVRKSLTNEKTAMQRWHGLQFRNGCLVAHSKN
ncbi:MAG: hypothetical protein U1F52_02990 [Burkholderiales bacterium]